MAGESTTSSRWGTARAFVGRDFARVLIAVSQIPTWFIPLIEGKKVGDLSIGNWVIPPLRDSSATAVLIGLAIVVLVIGGIAELLRDRKNKQHAVDLSHMQDAFASALHVHDALDAATREALWGFTDEIGVTREGTSLLPDRARCRITLYIHHESDNLFTPIHSSMNRIISDVSGRVPMRKKPKRLSTTHWCPATLDSRDATVRFLQQGPRALIPQHVLRDERPASIASPCATTHPALVPRSCRLPA